METRRYIPHEDRKLPGELLATAGNTVRGLLYTEGRVRCEVFGRGFYDPWGDTERNIELRA